MLNRHLLCGSETWCLKEREVELLRTERAMIRAIFGMKLIDRKNTEELMQMFVVTVPIEIMVSFAAVRWYGHGL